MDTLAHGVGPNGVKRACHCGRPKWTSIILKYVVKLGAKKCQS